MPKRGARSKTLRQKLATVKSKLASAVESDAGNELKLAHKKIRATVKRELEAAKKARRRKSRVGSGPR